MSNTEITPEELNVSLQLAVDERDLKAHADLMARAQAIAEGRAKARTEKVPVNAGNGPVAASQARVDENAAEIAGAPITPGDDVAKAAAAGEAASEPVVADAHAVEARTEAKAKADSAEAKAKSDAAEARAKGR